ncbi:Sec1 family protein [Giardia muris]|uniref:Sec1 family protein n=1 Tax=Giardia muris TaxID=5742 RepID=A0A4Z1SZI9_GIAMU|nr:Sec1 family protein [Giardia muris]|eukprot:TNJ30165.1 Sec1 family protein [Giardia muris]
MQAERITDPREHPVYRFFAHYPQQLRPLLRQYLEANYFSKIARFLESKKAYGVLLLDEYTLPIISELFENAELTAHRLVLKNLISVARKQQPEMFGVYFVSNTLASLQDVARDFGWNRNGAAQVASFEAVLQEKEKAGSGCCSASPGKVFPYTYKGLFVLTTGTLSDEAQQFVLSSNLQSLLPKAGVMSTNVDFVIEENRFVNLRQPEAFLVAYGAHRFAPALYDELKSRFVDRAASKLWSFFMALQMGPPEIRYYKSAERTSMPLCQEIATALLNKLQQHPLVPDPAYQKVSSTLIIVDRAFDPVSVLAHNSIVSSYLTDFLGLTKKLFLLKDDRGQTTEVDIGDDCDAWNGFRFMPMQDCCKWYRNIIQLFREIDPIPNSKTMETEQKTLNVKYGRHEGRTMITPRYSIVDSSMFTNPYNLLLTQLLGVGTLLSQYFSDVEAKGYPSYLLAAEAQLFNVFMDQGRISSLSEIAVGENKMSFSSIAQMLVNPAADATLPIRLVLYLILVLEKSGQSDHTLSNFAQVSSFDRIANLAFTYGRTWELPSNISNVRELWSGFLRAFVPCDFVKLWTSMTRNKTFTDLLAQECSKGMFVPGTECIFRGFSENSLSKTHEELFPVVPGFSLSVPERKRRGGTLKKDILLGGTGNAAARFYPDSPEGERLRETIARREVASYKNREKVYIYVLGGVTPAEILSAYTVTGDARIPEPSPFNEVFWTPELADFDCILLSDDSYTPSAFLRRLCTLVQDRIESIEEALNISRSWSE